MGAETSGYRCRLTMIIRAVISGAATMAATV